MAKRKGEAGYDKQENGKETRKGGGKEINVTKLVRDFIISLFLYTQ
jgi:hypothetical protein